MQNEFEENIAGIRVKLVEAPPQATPGYWYEGQIFDMLPSKLRDALNYSATGTQPESTVRVFVMWKKQGMVSALAWVKDLNDQARNYYQQQMETRVELKF